MGWTGDGPNMRGRRRQSASFMHPLYAEAHTPQKQRGRALAAPGLRSQLVDLRHGLLTVKVNLIVLFIPPDSAMTLDQSALM